MNILSRRKKCPLEIATTKENISKTVDMKSLRKKAMYQNYKKSILKK